MSSTLNNLLQELQFGRLEKTVKSHLTRVYTAMGLSLIACAVGSYLHMIHLFTAGLLTGLGMIGCVIALTVMTPTNENSGVRFALMMAVALTSGINQGPLLELVISINPSLVMTAFLATALVFVCFSVASLLSSDRKWLALGGVLFSAMSWLLILGILNIFFQSPLIFEAKLYIGLAVFCGYVLYDTQVIVEKRRVGDDDYIGHCLMLFLDFVNIFRHILILLTNKEVKSEKRNKKD